jgi:hypothetical protein
MFAVYILQIPSWCKQIFSGRIAPTCIPLAMGLVEWMSFVFLFLMRITGLKTLNTGNDDDDYIQIVFFSIEHIAVKMFNLFWERSIHFNWFYLIGASLLI